MEMLIPLEFETSTTAGAAQLNIIGDVKMIQKTPLFYRGRDYRFLQPKSFFQSSSPIMGYNEILDQYSHRLLTCKLDPVRALWTLSPNADVGFKLNLELNYVTDRFEYQTGFWELMKVAWIQYLSILVIFVFIAKRAREFVFNNRVFHVFPSQNSKYSRTRL